MMRHIYNAGDGSGDSFDKDEAWASCMESGEAAAAAGGVQPVRWVTMPAADQPDHHPTLMPDYICVRSFVLLSNAAACLHPPFIITIHACPQSTLLPFCITLLFS